MSVKNIIAEIERDVIDVIKTNFVHNETTVVPNTNDSQLTYESGEEKKGKKIKTCVLFVDIRNSVALTEKHHTQTMGRIYTAFTKAVLKVARHHNGHIRNIIGDRVMVVFPSTNCFTNAVECAISINHIAKYIIKKQFSGVDFKCGIGIDYGELRVIKVGIQRYGTENGENKGLVWVGYPANIASRLTDMANKTVEYYKNIITYKPLNPSAFNPISTSLLASPYYPIKYDPHAPMYLDSETIEMSNNEFANSISSYIEGELYWSKGKFVKLEKKLETTIYPEILMTEIVYNGYRNANPQNISILNNNWKEQTHQIDNVSSKVYGGNLIWSIQ